MKQFSLFLTILSGVFCSISQPASAQDKELTLYTQRHYAFDQEVYARFQEQTGIKINVVKASADELITRLEEEGANTAADLFMATDGGALYRAHSAGLLQPTTSTTALEKVKPPLREKDAHWVAMTKRARVIVHSKDRVDPSELSTYEALADKKWRGRIVVRSSTNSYNQALLTTIIDADGRDKALEWATAVRKNMARPPQGSDRDQVRAISAGLADVAIVNTYYIGLLETSEEQKDRDVAAAVKIFFPNQDDRGTHINISGLGIVKASKKADLANQFIDFLLSEEIQKLYPANTFEYPVVEGTPLSDRQLKWGEFKADDVDFSVLGKLHADAIKVFNEAGWE
ncbi:MAG: extracellular solute-binding protein [Verrucomicrobiales bacterium]|nr:extracellular solute-binding protein [Verrucomicrobiales bacterium]